MIGTGAGTGYTLNIPLGAGAGDDAYRAELRRRVIPALERYAPEFILISAGFDAHAEDPLSGALLSSAAFGELTAAIAAAAERPCAGRIVSLLEGGYDLEALADSVESHVGVLAGV